MKGIFKSLLEFLETKSGLLILGFVVTTVCGSLLNYQIQAKQEENNHRFEMYKTRLSEAKNLQEKLLKNSTSRSFYLEQVSDKLHHPEVWSKKEIQKYWDDNVTATKDRWNTDLHYLHAQTRSLFTPILADMLLIYKENIPRPRDPVLEKLNESTYEKEKPRSLQGAFRDAHATLYYLLKKCNKPKDCNRDDLLKLADKQINDLELVHNCLTYRISAELLQYPYGPKKQTEIKMPDECVILLEH